jgi:hypothetical protein
MVLLPLNCTRCGAPLRDEPKEGLLRCAHCGQNHALDAPDAPEPVPVQPVHRAPPSWRKSVAALGALAVVGVAATLLLHRGGASQEPYAVSAGSEGPGEPGLSYTAGETVDIYWGSRWWPGQIKAVLGAGRYRIGYDGWSASWDEDVTARRLRRRGR